MHRHTTGWVGGVCVSVCGHWQSEAVEEVTNATRGWSVGIVLDEHRDRIESDIVGNTNPVCSCLCSPATDQKPPSHPAVCGQLAGSTGGGWTPHRLRLACWSRLCPRLRPACWPRRGRGSGLTTPVVPQPRARHELRVHSSLAHKKCTDTLQDGWVGFA